MPRSSSAERRAVATKTRRIAALARIVRIDSIFLAALRKSIRAATAEFNGGSAAAAFTREELADKPLRRFVLRHFEVVTFFEDRANVFAGAELAVLMYHVGIPASLARGIGQIKLSVAKIHDPHAAGGNSRGSADGDERSRQVLFVRLAVAEG